MGKFIFALAWPCALLLGLIAEPVAAFYTAGRWSRTATNSSTGTLGSSITLTWSFAPDGTQIPVGDANVSSNLLTMLDTNWGVGPGGSDLTQRPWFPIFSRAYDRLSALSGVTYVYEPHDDGHDFEAANDPTYRGVLGVRGDTRLGGRSFEAGSSVLAVNFFPDFGEMMINTDQVSLFHDATNNYRGFRDVLMHESMHGLGVNHVESNSSGFLMEPAINTSFDGPQLDDLLALHRLYGDVNEKGLGGNDFSVRATPLGVLGAAQSLAVGTLGNSTQILSNQTDFLSIDDDSDTDFFSFTLESRLDVTLSLTPRGVTYAAGPQDGTQLPVNAKKHSDLSLALLGSDGTSTITIAAANDNPAGVGEQIIRQLAPGTYFARVKGANDYVQLYGLNLIGNQPVGRDLVWSGVAGAAWDVGITANFSDGAAPTAFYEEDNVTFDDTATTKIVQLSNNVTAGDLRVDTDDNYLFEGPGGIVEGSLTIAGDGTVELANSGNSYAGETQVLAGTLAITGDANAMRTTISVADGATLLMDASDAAEMTCAMTVGAGGILQIGTPTSSSNVFPDVPTAVVNQGTIRVFASESLRNVSGAGQIVVESGQTTFASNLEMAGQIAVKSGAVARVADSAGLGAAATQVTIESGGTLQAASDATISQAIQLDDGATLELADADAFDQSSRLTGQGQIVGALSTPGAIQPGNLDESTGSLDFNADLTLSDASQLEFRVGGLIAETDFAVIHIQGAAVLAGTLQLSLLDGFMPSLGDAFKLVTAAGGMSGIFDTLLLPGLEMDRHWDINYGANTLLLTVASDITALPGEFNADGIVDAADYTVWRDGLGTIYSPDDYDAWKAHFGQSVDTLAATPAARVPEPTTQTFAMLGMMLFTTTRTLRALRACRRAR